MVELDGQPAPNVLVSFAGPVVAAREVNAQEHRSIGRDISNGSLSTSFTPYQPRTFALRLGSPAVKLTPVQSQPVELQYDLAVASNDDTKTDGAGFDGKGDAIPAEMLPSHIAYDGVDFNFAPAKTGTPDAVVAKGQSISLPPGHYNRVYILAASASADQTASFRIGAGTADLNIEDWGGFIGQWDTRIWKIGDTRNWAISANHAPWPPADMQKSEERPPNLRYPEDYVGLEPGFIKPAGLAWYASHHHTADGLNHPYQYSYLFAYSVPCRRTRRHSPCPTTTRSAFSLSPLQRRSPELKPAQPLYDMLNRTEPPTAAPSSSASR